MYTVFTNTYAFSKWMRCFLYKMCHTEAIRVKLDCYAETT